MDQINLWPQATTTRRTVSWTRENEGEGACTDLWEAGSRLIYFHKSLRDISANQPVRARLQSPGFPSLLGAVDVFSSEQCSCTPQISARSLSAMVLKWMVIQIPALAACRSYPRQGRTRGDAVLDQVHDPGSSPSSSPAAASPPTPEPSSSWKSVKKQTGSVLSKLGSEFL